MANPSGPWAGGASATQVLVAERAIEPLALIRRQVRRTTGVEDFQSPNRLALSWRGDLLLQARGDQSLQLLELPGGAVRWLRERHPLEALAIRDDATVAALMRTLAGGQ